MEFTIILFTFAYSKFANSIACKFRKMDIATRLKQFMTAKNIASSQFADSADIPRPTLSQLLNGRNKKISNELIGKIHEAFPSLNVMWLMFGEGDMECAVNTQISEPQKAPVSTPSEVQEPRYEAVWAAQAPASPRPCARHTRTPHFRRSHPGSQQCRRAHGRHRTCAADNGAVHRRAF